MITTIIAAQIDSQAKSIMQEDKCIFYVLIVSGMRLRFTGYTLVLSPIYPLTCISWEKCFCGILVILIEWRPELIFCRLTRMMMVLLSNHECLLS